MEENNKGEVTIVDVKIPFTSMVVLIVKTAIASIPAIIILTIIGMLTFGILGGIIL